MVKKNNSTGAWFGTTDIPGASDDVLFDGHATIFGQNPDCVVDAAVTVNSISIAPTYAGTIWLDKNLTVATGDDKLSVIHGGTIAASGTPGLPRRELVLAAGTTLKLTDGTLDDITVKVSSGARLNASAHATAPDLVSTVVDVEGTLAWTDGSVACQRKGPAAAIPMVHVFPGGLFDIRSHAGAWGGATAADLIVQNEGAVVLANLGGSAELTAKTIVAHVERYGRRRPTCRSRRPAVRRDWRTAAGLTRGRKIGIFRISYCEVVRYMIQSYCHLRGPNV